MQVTVTCILYSCFSKIINKESGKPNEKKKNYVHQINNIKMG